MKYCVICGGELIGMQKKYCLVCKPYIDKPKNMVYHSKKCTVCGEPLTAHDMYRTNRKFYRPNIEDCERCENSQKFTLIYG